MKSIRARILTNNGLMVFIAVFLMVGLFIWTIHQYYYSSLEREIGHQVGISADFYSTYLMDKPLQEKALYILDNTSGDEKFTIQVITPEGQVLMDSSGITRTITDLTADINSALSGTTGLFRGTDETTAERILAASSPIYGYDGRIIGVLRYVSSIEAVDDAVEGITLAAVVIGLIVIVTILTFSLFIVRSIVEPVEELTAVAENIARGDFSQRTCKSKDDEIGRLADTLNYMADEINRSEKVKNDFIASVSHELRTPLTSIKGWAETLLTGSLDNHEELKMGLNVIVRENDRLQGLVEELLDFSRFQSGRMKVHLASIDIAELVQEVVEQFTGRGVKQGIQLQFMNKDNCDIMIQADSDRLIQVLVNILDNAFKFTPTGGDIKVSTAVENEAVKIEVVDNGLGIADEDLPHVSEKFYKGKSKLAGSGLGLSICQEIINLHGGKMDIMSKPGQGTSVLIYIPI